MAGVTAGRAADVVDRVELDRLVRRIDAMDATGTRGLAVLAVQVQEIAKDLARHEVMHQNEAAARAATRRWLVGAVIAVIAAVDGPVVTVLLAHYRLARGEHVMPGYPDWQRQPLWQGTPLVNLYGASFPAGQTLFGPWPMLSFGQLLVVASGQAGSHRLTVSWWDDQAMTKPIYTDIWDFNGGETLTVTVPAGGPWVSVTMDNKATAAQTGNLQVTPTNTPGGLHGYSGNVLTFGMYEFSGNVAGGATFSTVCNVLYSGPATLSVHASVSGLWHVGLFTWSAATAAWTEFFHHEAAASERDNAWRVSLPRKSVRVDLINFGTSAHTFEAGLIAG